MKERILQWETLRQLMQLAGAGAALGIMAVEEYILIGCIVIRILSAFRTG